MSDIERALSIALRAHSGQRDRAGLPYILHPLRVMSHVETLEQKIVAILHDVVEDSDITLDDLKREGFSEAIVTAVDCLTKRKGEPYEGLIARAKLNSAATAVKLADLRDNMDLRRNRELKQDDLERLQRYLRGWRELNAGTAG